MKHTEAIARLCKLQSDVAAHIGDVSAADCFCGQSGFWNLPGYNPENDYRNDGNAIEFIEQAVNEKIENEKGQVKK